jgi:elongation factor G
MRPCLVEMAIEPKSKADRGELSVALARLALEDLSFRISTNSKSGQILLQGMDDLHLKNKVDLLKRIHKIEVNVGAPQVAYRETITRKAEVDYTHKKQTGGTGQFSRVILEIEPNEKGKGNMFESNIIGDTVPEKFIPGVEKGVNAVMASGVVAGFPILDVKVALTDGAYHEVDSSAIAFEIAARAALCEGLQKAGSVLLEPVMKVEVTTPEDYLGGVIGDLNSRRGQIIGTGNRGNAQIINALVPMANMFGYVNDLRSMSRERATYTMQFDHYEQVPHWRGDDPPPFRPAMGMRP